MDERLGKLLGCLKERASRGHYIYRGESRYYDKISSGLYREHLGNDIADFNECERQKLKNNYDFEDIAKAEKPINLSNLATGDIDRILDYVVQEKFLSQKGQKGGGIYKILTNKELYELYVALLQHGQHQGGSGVTTNLIDFSESLYIALFFSASINPIALFFALFNSPMTLPSLEIDRPDSDERTIFFSVRSRYFKFNSPPTFPSLPSLEIDHPDSDGRIIFFDARSRYVQKVSWDLGINNAKDQQSVFVRHPKGIIDDEIEEGNIISIPKELKKPLLEYLKKEKEISPETVYRDWATSWDIPLEKTLEIANEEGKAALNKNPTRHDNRGML